MWDLLRNENVRALGRIRNFNRKRGFWSSPHKELMNASGGKCLYPDLNTKHCKAF